MTRGKHHKLKLLVVDDEPDNLDLLYRTFRRDFQVFRAESGIKALDVLANSGEMAVIISDQRMPGMSGTEFLSRTVEQFPNTMRIVLTGYTDVADLVEAINSGQVFKYITKPWEPGKLKEVVTQASETYQAVSRRTQELQRALQRESLFNGILNAIRESLNYHSMLQTVVETIGQAFEAHQGVLYPVERGQLAPSLFRFDPSSEPDSPVPHSIQEMVDRVLNAFHQSQNQAVVMDEANAIGLPLTYQKELLGILVLTREPLQPSWRPEETQLLESVAEQSSIAVSQARLYQHIQAQSEKLQAELAVARQIQTNLLRQSVPELENARIQACCRPALAVGGDFFEVYVHPQQGDIWLAVGDVSGKGVPAALYMASTLSLLRRELAQEISPHPEEVIRSLNRNLLEDLASNNCFITAALVRYRPNNRELAYANAGHIYPMVWHTTAPAPETESPPKYLKARGIPLGILPEWKGQSSQCTLDQGEFLLLTSDGITEARVHTPDQVNSDGDEEVPMLQQDGLWQILKERFRSPELDELLDYLQTHSSGQDDDQTLVSLEIL
jgi:serine phosphatase RsbU (regulator of sigma subunit)/FixJ family two-component response regulator